MVNFEFKSLRPTKYGLICSLLFLAIFLIFCANYFLHGKDDDSQLILDFFGFPMSWIFFSIFDPLLEWVGSYGDTSREYLEWILLGAAGMLQYWLIGTVVAYLIIGESHRDE